MTTRDIVQRYLDAVARGSGWDELLAEGATFVSYSSPVKRLAGKPAYLAATGRFYSTVETFRVNALIVEGERACALTHYVLRGPGGAAFESDVAEIFTVMGGRIEELAIYFDTAPYPR